MKTLTIILLLTLACRSVAQTKAKVSLRNGTVIEGQVVSIEDTIVSFLADGQTQKLDANQIRAIDIAADGDPTSNAAAAKVVLTDGTIIAAKNYSVNGETAVVKLEEQELKFPAIRVHHVRFGKTNKKLDRQWDEILKTKLEGDAIVIRRPESVVSFLEGVLGDVSNEIAKFEYDGDWNDVKREKVDGFVYFAVNPVVHPPATCVVTTGNGMVIQAESLQFSEAKFSVASTNKTEFQFDARDVRKLEFAQTNTDFLSDLEMEYTWQPDLPIPELAEELEQLNRPSLDKSLLGKKLSIAMKPKGRQIREFEKGIAIRSKTEVTYRLAGEYRRFQTYAGIDEQILPHGKLQLIIMGDQKKLFDKMISGSDPAIKIDLDVTGVRKMKIIADFGDKSGLGDHLNLCEAKLNK